MKTGTMRRLSGGGLLGVLAILGVTAAPAAAQLSNASVGALGVGDNYTAVARGFSAVNWNPANLALPGNPGGSFAMFSTLAVSGLGPIDLADVADNEGEILPNSVKEAWLAEIAADGGEEGTGGASVTYLAAQVGRFGFQVTTNVHAGANVGPGAAELLLFGNAGRTGEPVDVTLGPSTIDAAATTTGAVSFALPVSSGPGSTFGLGATVKYTVGHVMVTGMDLGSQVDADPIRVDLNFPMVQTDTSMSSINNGSGIGLDLGGAWQQGPLTVSGVVRNVFNTFEWNQDQLHYRPGRALFTTGDDNESDFDAQDFANAPAEVKDRIDDIDYAPLVAVGVGYQVSPSLVVGADLRQKIGDSILMGPATHVGAGLEYTVGGFLPLRVGGAMQSGGYLLSGGFGVKLGAFNLGVAAATEQTDLGSGARAMFTISGGES